MLKDLGKYQIIDQIGKGSMGVVYKAKDPHIGRTVALKTILLPDASTTQNVELIKRLKQEAQAAGSLMHPNIVVIYEYGEEGDTAYIAMAYVEGRELKSFLDQEEKFSLSIICSILQQILSALNYSHLNDITHRDIKPSNIMIMPNGHIMVTDFGIARLESSELTQVGTAIGTPSYMSPEQCMGQRVDGRSDIFSAGIILYQLLTGEKPFDGPSVASILHKIVHSEPTLPSKLNTAIPEEFDAILCKCLAKDPEDRFKTAEEFSTALQKIVDDNALRRGSDEWLTFRKTNFPDFTSSEKRDETVSMAVDNEDEDTAALSQLDRAGGYTLDKEIDGKTVMLSDVGNVMAEESHPLKSDLSNTQVGKKFEKQTSKKDTVKPYQVKQKFLLYLVPLLCLLLSTPIIFKKLTRNSTVLPQDNNLLTPLINKAEVSKNETVTLENKKEISKKIFSPESSDRKIGKTAAFIAQGSEPELKDPGIRSKQVEQKSDGDGEDIINGSVELLSVPESASVAIEALGIQAITPVILNPGPGMHQLYVSKQGFHDMSIIITMKDQEQISLTIPLDPL